MKEKPEAEGELQNKTHGEWLGGGPNAYRRWGDGVTASLRNRKVNLYIVALHSQGDSFAGLSLQVN